MANFRNYSFQNYNIIMRVNDTTRNLTRRATGDFSIIVRDEDIFSKEVFNDGEVIQNRRINESGSMTINYAQISPNCDFLDNLHKKMEKGVIVPDDVAIEITDNLSNRVWELQAVSIQKPANENFGVSVGNRSYNIIASKVDKITAGDDE